MHKKNDARGAIDRDESNQVWLKLEMYRLISINTPVCFCRKGSVYMPRGNSYIREFIIYFILTNDPFFLRRSWRRTVHTGHSRFHPAIEVIGLHQDRICTEFMHKSILLMICLKSINVLKNEMLSNWKY